MQLNSRACLISFSLTLLALAVVISTLIVTHAFKEIKFGRGVVQVKGCAEKEIQSDFVKWQGTLTASAETQKGAFEKLEKDLAILHTYMQELGVSAQMIAFSPIYTRILYQKNSQGHDTNAIESYILSVDFSLASQDILLVAKVSQNITSLLKDDLSISSLPPQYFYLKIDALKIEMLGEAAKDALLRAEELVKRSGSKVGGLNSAHQGVFQITPAYASSVSDYGEYDTSSVAKKIKAVVTMEYGIVSSSGIL